MSKIPTAEEFLLLNNFKNNTEAMIEFAKLHVQAALKEASKNAKCSDDAIVDLGHTIIDAYVEKDSILNAYPLTNIK